jgi:signal transduction histidine kinase/ActR/RegA family two-component response regulator
MSRTLPNEETEKKLKETAAHLQSLLTSLEDIVFEIDGNQVFKNVWVRDEAILFLPVKDFLGKEIKEVMGPQHAVFTEPIHEVMRTGEAQEVIYKHPEQNISKWYKAKIRPVIKAPDPSNYVMVLSIQDITRQKLSELALREAKEQLELTNRLLDVSQGLSQTAGWEFTPKTGEIFWTRQAYILFGVDEDFRPTLENIRTFFTSKESKMLNRHGKNILMSREPYDIELKIHTAKGENKWVRAIGMPVVKQGEVVLVKGALMDITLKKENELELIKARNAAEAASKTKSDFLSVMSHEIRTPLNGIIGIANLLKLRHTVDQKEYISNLIFSADHLMQLINDILDLTKIENDKLELIFAEVHLLQLVENIKNQFRSLAEAKGIRLESFIDENIPPRVLADPIRLGQILNNLISNAIKFTDEGKVSLIMKLVSSDKETATVHFSVKDTGMGIPKELQKTVFESFKQVQQSAYRKHSGTGLGLTITQKLAKLHNSHIFLKSIPGRGSEFYFNLTFNLLNEYNAPQTAAASPVPSGSREKGLKGLRVLFVEDNPINMMVTQKQLEYFGVHPDCVYSGKEALAMLEKNHYHVALLDLHMPEMDGYALSGILRKKYPEVHIVIFTADILTEVKVRLAGMHIYDILNKPFSPEKMYEILARIAQEKQGNKKPEG